MQQPELEAVPTLTEAASQEISLAPRDERVRTIVQSLRVIFGSIQAHSHWIEQLCGVSAVQLWALRELSRSPGLKVTELALALTVHPSNCSSMVDKLRKKSLVRKQRIGPDQRVVRLYITPKGQELLEAAPPISHGSIVDVLNAIPEDMLASLDASLTGLIKRLKVKDPIAAMRPLTDR
jgi:MarR family transcriptional regulator, organic hydroperoxide resistance regulator